MMVKENMADGSVAGSASATADVMRAGIQCIGMPEGISIVPGFFFRQQRKPWDPKKIAL